MSCVDSVSCAPRDNSTALNSQKPSDSSATVQAAQVKVSQSQTADITIVTAEGDTVTLSSSKASELTFATYSAQGQVGDSSVRLSGMSAELHRTSAFSMSVDGDLNKEELKDIRYAIRTIQKAAMDVLKGHEEKAAARTASLSNLDQIASIDADLEFSREVSVTQVSAKATAAAVPAAADSSAPEPAAASNSSQSAPTEAETPAPVWTPDIATTTTSAAATATASSHLSVLIHTQTGSDSTSAPDSSRSGLWWFPSQDLWNILHPKKDSLTSAAASAVDSETPATV